MNNLIRMDLYRMRKSKGFWICLVLALAFALLMTPLVWALASLGRMFSEEMTPFPATALLTDIIKEPFPMFNAMLALLAANAFFFADIDVVVRNTENKRHALVDFENYNIRRIKHLLHAAVRKPIAEVTVSVHFRYRDHGYIYRSLPSEIIRSAVSEQHRHIKCLPFIYILSVYCRAVPEIVSKSLVLRIFLDYLHRPHRNRIMDLYVRKLISPLRQRLIQRDRERTCL